MAVPNIMTVAGSDSGGGAGIQADIKTVMAMGGYGMSAITALTAQNGQGVAGIFPASAEFVTLQIQTIVDGFPVAAAKTGMLFNSDIIKAVAMALRDRDFPLVVDPVSVATAGSRLLEESAIATMIQYLLPLASLITPNIPEAEMLSGMRVRTIEEQALAGKKILDLGPAAVLVKGGHNPGPDMVTDVLVMADEDPVYLPVKRVHTADTHGTGCTLSAAIATGLGQGLDVVAAVRQAQHFLSQALAAGYNPGKGVGPVNHAAGLFPAQPCALQSVSPT